MDGDHKYEDWTYFCLVFINLDLLDFYLNIKQHIVTLKYFPRSDFGICIYIRFFFSLDEDILIQNNVLQAIIAKKKSIFIW